MTKIRVIEVNTYTYDTNEFEPDYYEENGAHSDMEKLALDKKDVEDGELHLRELDPKFDTHRSWSIVID